MKNNDYRKWLYPFLFGFLIGILLILVCGKWTISHFFPQMQILQLMNMQLDKGLFFLYTLRIKCIFLLTIYLLSSTRFFEITKNAFLVYIGIGLGCYLTAAAVRFGILGILLILISIFPHYILYVPAFVMLFMLCEEQHLQKRNMNRYFHLAVIFIVVIIGAVLESYVNSSLLIKFVKILK